MISNARLNASLEGLRAFTGLGERMRVSTLSRNAHTPISPKFCCLRVGL